MSSFIHLHVVPHLYDFLSSTQKVVFQLSSICFSHKAMTSKDL